jgi:hypothetical protein
MSACEFGFLPEMNAYRGGGVVIEPHPDIARRIASLEEHGEVHKGWFYPLSTSIPPAPPSPRIPPLRYSLPDTHILTTSSGKLMANRSLCDLLFTVLGFLRGLRLVPVGYYHPARAATNIGQLVDFSCSSEQVETALDKAALFKEEHGAELSQRLMAACHWYLASQSYLWEFEVFNGQYIVLDSCWGLFSKVRRQPGGRPHSKRVVIMCEALRIPIPAWSGVEQDSRLSRLRNALFHNALFSGGPLGFESPEENIVTELTRLNSRLLIALLGVDSDYIKLPVNSGMRARL